VVIEASFKRCFNNRNLKLSIFKLNEDLKIYTSKEYDELIYELSLYRKKDESPSKENYVFPFSLKLEKKAIEKDRFFDIINGIEGNKLHWTISIVPHGIKSERLYKILLNAYKNVDGLSLICENRELHFLNINELFKCDGVVLHLVVRSEDIYKLKEELSPINEMKRLFLGEKSNLSIMIGKDVCSSSYETSLYFSTIEFRVYMYIFYGIALNGNEDTSYVSSIINGIELSEFGIKCVEDAKEFFSFVDSASKNIVNAYELKVISCKKNYISLGSKKTYECFDTYIDRASSAIKNADLIIEKNGGNRLKRESLIDFIESQLSRMF